MSDQPRYGVDASRVAAAILFAVGMAVTAGATLYEIGSLRRMGPGYFPILLGVSLCVLSFLMLMETRPIKLPETSDEPHIQRFQARVFLFPIAGILSFALLINRAGFIPAILTCSILTGLADRANKGVELVVIAVLVAIFAAAVFVFALGTPVRLVIF